MDLLHIARIAFWVCAAAVVVLGALGIAVSWRVLAQYDGEGR